MTRENLEPPPLDIGLTLPNVMHLTRPLREFLTLTLEPFGWPDDVVEEIGLVVTGLANNSFEHASSAATHHVGIRVEVDADRFVFRIHDIGEGRLRQDDFHFEAGGPPDHLALPDPVLLGRGQRPGGPGGGHRGPDREVSGRRGVTESMGDLPQGRPGDTFAGFLTGDANRDQRNIDILLDTIAEVSSTIDLGDLFVSVVDKTLEITQAERGILMLFDDEGALQVQVARDSLKRDLPPDISYSHSVPEKVAREGTAETLIDAASHSDASLGQSILDLRLLTVMCVPLKVREKIIGVLYVDSRASSREFNDSDLMLFKALSYQLAIAIENARLVNEAIERQRLQQSLLIAQDIQRSLLPPGRLDLPSHDIYGISEPCDETGGDYFDYIRVRDGRLGLVVGDVSGHGIGAALFMATARALLRAFVSTHAGLDGVFRDLNNSLERDMGTGSFMTLFYGDLDVRENLLRYVRAGHNEPLLYRPAESGFRELTAPGMALGFVRDYEYEVAGPVELLPGDILILYTDGIPEARNRGKEQFGMARFQEIVESYRTRSSREIVEGIVRRVRDFAGQEQFEDDLTLIVVKVAGD